MKADEVLKLLTKLDRRLATIRDQARETREQAQHTLDRLDRLRQDLERIRHTVIASVETSDSIPITKGRPPAR
jgi:septal ring factor EnvC (AmiA/AmiB activator)